MATINNFLVRLVLFMVMSFNASLAHGAIHARDDIRYPKRVLVLADKIDNNLKEKYYLQYKNKKELLVILNHIDKKSNKYFTTEKLTAIAIRESKLNTNAINQRDGTKGLFQVKTWWKKSMPWYKNPNDPFQSIQAAVNILNYNKAYYNCSSSRAIELFNGTDRTRTSIYIQGVNAIYRDICRTKA